MGGTGGVPTGTGSQQTPGWVTGSGRRALGPAAHLVRGPVYVTLQVGLGFIIYFHHSPPSPFRDRSVYIFPPYFYSWSFTGWRILFLSVWSVGGIEKYHWEFGSRIVLLIVFCLQGGGVCREGVEMTRVAEMFFSSVD